MPLPDKSDVIVRSRVWGVVYPQRHADHGDQVVTSQSLSLHLLPKNLSLQEHFPVASQLNEVDPAKWHLQGEHTLDCRVVHVSKVNKNDESRTFLYIV